MPCPANTPLLRKLGIKSGQRTAFLNAPDGWIDTLGLWPADVTVEAADAADLDVIVFFGRSQAEVRGAFAGLARQLRPAGGLWVAWPKQASRVPTDLREAVVQAIGLEAGLVDNKVCSIDATWSALRFVYRLVDRPGASTNAC